MSEYMLHLNDEETYDVHINILLSKDDPLNCEFAADRSFEDVPRLTMCYMFNKVVELKSLLEKLLGIRLLFDVKESKNNNIFIELSN